MAIIDKTLVFTDGRVLADGASDVVALNALVLPGRMQTIPLRVTVTEGYAAADVLSLTLTMQQADSAAAPESGEGAWTDVPGATLTVAVAELTAGTRLPWRFIPEGVTKGWLRLNYTLTPVQGRTPAAGALFAAVLREEDFPYVRAQQVK